MTSAEVRSYSKSLTRIASTVAFGLLVSCGPTKDTNQNLPEEISSALDDLNPGAFYAFYNHPQARVYIVTAGNGGCGSSGCGTQVFIEQDGVLKRAFDGQAYLAIPNFEDPDVLTFNFKRSGFVCDGKATAPHCVQLMKWDGKSLKEVEHSWE